MAAALMEISGELMRDFLRLPGEASIYGARDMAGESILSLPTIKVLVEHPDIPAEAVKVQPIFSAVYGSTVFERFDVVESREACSPS
jgi:hypothetical protein